METVAEASDRCKAWLKENPGFFDALSSALLDVVIDRKMATFFTMEEHQCDANLIYGIKGTLSVKAGRWSLRFIGEHGFDLDRINATIGSAEIGYDPSQVADFEDLDSADRVRDFLIRELSAPVPNLRDDERPDEFDVYCGRQIASLTQGNYDKKVNLKTLKTRRYRKPSPYRHSRAQFF